MIEALKASLWEIKRSTTLRFAGAILAASHAMTYFSWAKKAGDSFMCWSFFPQCQDLFIFDGPQIKIILWTYLAASLFSALCFTMGRLFGTAWFFLFVAWILKTFLYLRDFTLASNIHNFLLLLHFFYLFVPQKVRILRFCIFGYFLVSGLHKCNSEWLAGYWIMERWPGVPIKAVEWMAAMSMLIELIVPFLLYSKNPPRFATALGILLVYQGGLAYLDGYMAPMVMSMFIVLHMVWWFENERLEREYMYQSFIRPEPSVIWAPFGALLFVLLQLLPVLPLSLAFRDLPLTLRPPPTPVECHQFSVVNYRNSSALMPGHVSPPGPLHCHPYVHFQAAQALCKRDDSDFIGVSSYFLRRTYSETTFQRVFELENVCTSSYRSFEKGGS